MKKRIGKDLVTRWTVTTNGVATSLVGRSLILEIAHTSAGLKYTMPFTIEGTNTVLFTWYGKNQEKVGTYTLTLWENKGKVNQTAIDTPYIELVAWTFAESGTSSSSLNVESVNLETSNIQESGRGYSAYECWLADGHTGTLSDFLVWLKGAKGDPGDKGDPGVGVPKGGMTGQVLCKKSETDYDTEWSNRGAGTVWGDIQGTLSNQTDLNEALAGKVDKVAGKGLSTNDYTNTDKQKVADAYVKPNGGIPSSDLSSTVQASLGKADTALQEHQDISGKQDKIDASHKLPYSYLSGTPTIPTKTSELTNDSGFLTSHQSLAEYRTSEDQDDIDDGIKDRLNDLEAKTALSDFTDDLGSSPTHTHQTYQDQINALKSIGRFLAIWNCSTGKPLTDPTELPYTYKTGDYYRVGAVSTGTNYKPNGATYTGVASTTVETDDVKTGWVYYYDGTQWKVQSGGATIPVVDVQAEGTSVLDSATGVANVTRSSLGLGNVNNTSDANKPISTATQTALNAKQDTISDLATIRSNAAAGKTASDNLAGHTVAKNVPADAVFTDTVYDDTALSGRVTTIEGKESGWDGKYSKPSGGIPKTDLASGVQESLGKADSALQSYTETDPVFVASAAHGISASDISNWNSKQSALTWLTDNDIDTICGL